MLLGKTKFYIHPLFRLATIRKAASTPTATAKAIGVFHLFAFLLSLCQIA